MKSNLSVCWFLFVGGFGALLAFSAVAAAYGTPNNSISHSSSVAGLSSRPGAKAYLNMPTMADGPLPRLLSQTGAFRDTLTLRTAEALIPYELNVPFWSDGASKWRWISLPEGARISFQPQGEWSFPPGTVLIKHFEMPVDETDRQKMRRLETRLLVLDASGHVYGVTYKWRPDNSDAELLTSNVTERITIKTASGVRTQAWYYPSSKDCRECHTDKARLVLGPKTRQLNHSFTAVDGTIRNELAEWNRLGMFEPAFDPKDLPGFDRLVAAGDSSHSIEERARSYLDANCASCHRPGGTVAEFDARYDTPLPRQNLIDGAVLIDEGIDRARLIAPNDIWRSIALLRVSSLEGNKMPPLAHQVRDETGLSLLRDWILSLPGAPVLPPPTFSKQPGKYSAPLLIEVKHPEPGCIIHYTLDGSVPTPSDAIYEKPLQLSEPTTLRAKAFKKGFTRSITAQATYLVQP